MKRLSRGEQTVRRERLPIPLGDVLADPVDEREVPRMWQGIERRRFSASRRATRTVWRLAVAIVLTGLALVWYRAPAHVSEASRSGGPDLGDTPLTEAIEVPSGAAARSVRMQDGSVIIAEPGARLEPLPSSRARSAVRLSRGRAVFDVQRRTDRRFFVEAGTARVEVVGTRFSVQRKENAVSVKVERGVVVVHSAGLPHGKARLERGQSVDVVEAPHPAETAPAGSEPAASARSFASASSAPAAPPPPVAGASEAWRKHASQGQHESAYADLARRGFDETVRRTDEPEDLFVLADVARLAGHPEQARAPLERLLRDYPRSSRAPLAAITLGRVELGFGRHVAAAKQFERALGLGVPSSLEEDVRVRIVECYARAGDQVAAGDAASTYFRRFPTGRRSADVKRWLSDF